MTDHINHPHPNPPGSITITTDPADGSTPGNGEPVVRRYVPAEVYDDLLDLAGNLRRTLAIAHMHLVLDPLREGRDRAAERIQADTGLRPANAQALREVIESVLAGDLTANT